MENDPAPRWKSSPPPAPGRIVMVDDEAELVRALSGMLRNEFGPDRVRDTVDAREALSWIERERPAVLITDVRMPGISGLELIARAREAWGTVPTVVMTAFSSPEVKSDATSGPFVYLPKPFPFRDLLDAVRELDATQPSSFSGAVAISTLAELLQLYATSGGTGLLAVRAGALRGEVWFDIGRIVHVRTEGKVGFEAFCDLVRWPHGSFTWKARPALERTIDVNTSELLLEAYRLWDEARRVEDIAREGAKVERGTTGIEGEAKAAARAATAVETRAMAATAAETRAMSATAVEARAATAVEARAATAAETKAAARAEAKGTAPGGAAGGGGDGGGAGGAWRGETRGDRRALRERSPNGNRENTSMNNVHECLTRLQGVDGFIGACVVDSDSGMTLGLVGGGGALNLEVAAAANTEVVRSKRKAMKALNIKDEIEDILITLGKQYHVLRPLRTRPGVFFYMALDRSRSNLAMARFSLADSEKELTL
jgi:CheY-like chemotaxis protein